MAKPQDFKKNDSRINKDGRPKGSKNFTTIVREALQVLSGVKEKDKNGNEIELTMEEVLAKKIVSDAIKTGDTALRRLIWNYLEGMPKQPIDLTSKGKSLVDDEQKKEGRKKISEFLRGNTGKRGKN